MTALRRLTAALLCMALCGIAVAAQPASSPAWRGLTAAQKQALAPLEREWSAIDSQQQSKWLVLAAGFSSMPVAERTRLHARMAEWTRMTPTERSRARLQFQDARQVPANERQAKWQAYQALSEDDRHALAQKAKPAARPASAPSQTAAVKPAASAGKQNVVQATAVPRSRAVSPTSQQVRPGATTTSITTRTPPPTHNQAGLPKIAATSGFVDPSTLLPQRGPQGAAVRAAAVASEPARQP